MVTQTEYAYSPVKNELEIKSKNFENFEEEYVERAPSVGKRHLQVCLCFLLGFVAFTFRVSLSVGMVAITDPTASSNPEIVTYPQWTKKNFILSSFFWGYIIPQVPAAWLAKTYGPKWFLVCFIFGQSILSILTPVTAAVFGETGMMVSRTMEGLFQGFVLPSSMHLMSQWVPPQERSRFGSVVTVGGKLGTLCSVYFTGTIAASSYGWPWAFRGLGFMGIVWCILMVIFGYNSPKDHPKISKVERTYIQKSLGHDDKHHKTPWKAIVTSPRVWALFIAQVGQSYSFWCLLTQIPTYMNYVMKFDMKNNAFWSSIPYLVMFILSYVFGFAADALINHGIFSRTVARKVNNSIGCFIPAAAIIALGYTRSDQNTQAISLIIIAISISSACYSGYMVNYMDLSPNHAAIIMGLCNGFAQITGVMAPIVVELLVTDMTDVSQWRGVFFTASGAYVLGATIFIIFGSGEVQWWNKAEEHEEEK